METFSQNILVRWADLDPNQHVRHSVYYDYGAQARMACLEHFGVGLGWLARQEIGPILFREEARFYRELKLGDELLINVLLAGHSQDQRKWSMRHEITRGATLCATIDLDGAWFDLRKRKILVPPDELKEKFSGIPRSDDFRILSRSDKRA